MVDGPLTVTVTDDRGRVLYSYSGWDHYVTLPNTSVLNHTVSGALEEAHRHIARLRDPEGR